MRGATMTRMFLICLAVSAIGALAEEPAWPADFWGRVAASRVAIAAKGEVRTSSSASLPAFDTWTVVCARSNGIDFRSDRSGTILIIR